MTSRVSRRMVETLEAGPAVGSGETGSTAAPHSADRSGPPRSAGDRTRAVLTGGDDRPWRTLVRPPER